MANQKMPVTSPPEIEVLFQYSALGGGIGAMAKSVKNNGFARAFVDGVVGGSLTVAVAGIAYYIFSPPWWLIAFTSGFVGMTADFMVMWLQRLAGSALFWMERRIWRDYDQKIDGDPPPEI